MGKYLDIVDAYEKNEMDEKSLPNTISSTLEIPNIATENVIDAQSSTSFVQNLEKESSSGKANSYNSFNSSLIEKSQFIERLPWKLERLIDAATNNLLDVSKLGVNDINRYVMAWGCTYLIGDKSEAVKRLEEISILRANS